MYHNLACRQQLGPCITIFKLIGWARKLVKSFPYLVTVEFPLTFTLRFAFMFTFILSSLMKAQGKGAGNWWCSQTCRANQKGILGPSTHHSSAHARTQQSGRGSENHRFLIKILWKSIDFELQDGIGGRLRGRFWGPESKFKTMKTLDPGEIVYEDLAHRSLYRIRIPYNSTTIWGDRCTP